MGRSSGIGKKFGESCIDPSSFCVLLYRDGSTTAGFGLFLLGVPVWENTYIGQCRIMLRVALLDHFTSYRLQAIGHVPCECPIKSVARPAAGLAGYRAVIVCSTVMRTCGKPCIDNGSWGIHHYYMERGSGGSFCFHTDT